MFYSILRFIKETLEDTPKIEGGVSVNVITQTHPYRYLAAAHFGFLGCNGIAHHGRPRWENHKMYISLASFPGRLAGVSH